MQKMEMQTNYWHNVLPTLFAILICALIACADDNEPINTHELYLATYFPDAVPADRACEYCDSEAGLHRLGYNIAEYDFSDAQAVCYYDNNCL